MAGCARGCHMFFSDIRQGCHVFFSAVSFASNDFCRDVLLAILKQCRQSTRFHSWLFTWSWLWPSLFLLLFPVSYAACAHCYHLLPLFHVELRLWPAHHARRGRCRHVLPKRQTTCCKLVKSLVDVDSVSSGMLEFQYPERCTGSCGDSSLCCLLGG